MSQGANHPEQGCGFANQTAFLPLIKEFLGRFQNARQQVSKSVVGESVFALRLHPLASVSVTEHSAAIIKFMLSSSGHFGAVGEIFLSNISPTAQVVSTIDSHDFKVRMLPELLNRHSFRIVLR
jgi:hypothetical protein